MGWAVHDLGGSTKCRVGLIFAPALSGAWRSRPRALIEGLLSVGGKQVNL